jgi:hypothetical protein
MSVTVGERRPLRNPHVLLREEGKEGFAINPRANSAHVMNATAVAIWVLCDGETTPTEMVTAVCELSKLPFEVVQEDVNRILGQFEEADLITWRDPA